MTKSTDKSLIEDTEIAAEDLVEDLADDDESADVDSDDVDEDSTDISALADDDVLPPVAVNVRYFQCMRLRERDAVLCFLIASTHHGSLSILDRSVCFLGNLFEPGQPPLVPVQTRHNVVVAIFVDVDCIHLSSAPVGRIALLVKSPFRVVVNRMFEPTFVDDEINSSVVVPFRVPETMLRGSEVALRVYNLMGQPVRTLAQGSRAPGRHTVRWDGRDMQGQAVASGVYLVRLETSSEVQSRKILYLQ